MKYKVVCFNGWETVWKIQWRAVGRIFGEAMELRGNGENFENFSLKRHFFKSFGDDLKKNFYKDYSFL